tara:strand:- start:339 stop:956 length:618 start_codon:yes stop_codon:yes gene_type:complete
MNDTIKKGLLSFDTSSVIPEQSLDELIKRRRKKERRERRALERLEKNEATIAGNEMVKQFNECKAESYLNSKFNTKTVDEEFINNSNKEKIIQSGLSDIIQKGFRYPSTKEYAHNTGQQKIFKSLSPEQKKNFYKHIQALNIMVFGDSFLVENWKNMFLLLFLAKQRKVKFHYLLLSETTYRVWKIDDKEKEYEKDCNGDINGNK